MNDRDFARFMRSPANANTSFTLKLGVAVGAIAAWTALSLAAATVAGFVFAPIALLIAAVKYLFS